MNGHLRSDLDFERWQQRSQFKNEDRCHVCFIGHTSDIGFVFLMDKCNLIWFLKRRLWQNLIFKRIIVIIFDFWKDIFMSSLIFLEIATNRLIFRKNNYYWVRFWNPLSNAVFGKIAAVRFKLLKVNNDLVLGLERR